MDKLRIISDFNVSNLASLFDRDENAPVLRADVAPFGQLGPALAGGDGEASFVWTLPAGVSPAFRRLAAGDRIDVAELDSDIQQFCDRLAGLADRSRALIVASLAFQEQYQAFGSLDLRPQRGMHWALMRANLAMAEALDALPNTVLLNVEHWLRAAGSTGAGNRLWYLSKTAFPRPVFEQAVIAVKRALTAINGGSRKLLLLDLDNTLWGGVLGDLGPEGLRLGGHDAVGEAFRDMQVEVRRLSRFGVALGIVSKNDEHYALECIRTHPEMVLQLDDFAGWRINWEDKAANVVSLVRELNLGLDSVVFLDDNPAERTRVRQALPEVLVPELPVDPMRFPEFVRSIGCFDAVRLTDEDHSRARMYAVERERRTTRDTAGSLNEWLVSLETQVSVLRLEPVDLVRTAQLLNKTNQMNLATRRMSQAEFEAWAGEAEHRTWTVRVADRFGEAGLTGILSMDFSTDDAVIEDFVLSCRVMGRGVEQAMVAVAVEEASRQGKASVVARYRRTDRNGPCLEFWEKSGFERRGDEFYWCSGNAFPWPEWLART